MLNEKYVSKILFLAFLASLLGFAFQAEAAQVRTRSGCLHLRSSNSSWGSLYKTGQCLPSGTNVQIIGRHKRNRKYLKVIVDGQVGYLWSRNIDRSRQGFNSQPHSRRHRPRRNNNRNQTPRVGRQAQIQTPQGDCLRLRSSRSAWGSLRKTGQCFKPGTKVKVIGRHKRNRKYLKVMVNGRTGYMWSPHLDQSNSQPDDIADSKPQEPRKKQMELPIRKKQEPKISDKGKEKKVSPEDLADINLETFFPEEEQKPVKPKEFIAGKGEKIEPRTEKPAEKAEQTPADEKEAETKVEKATAEYKKTLKAAHEAERVAREKEKRAKKLKGSTAYNEALREAQQKRLAADSLFKKVKEQYSDLIDSGLAKNVPVPVINIDQEKVDNKQAGVSEPQEKKDDTSVFSKGLDNLAEQHKKTEETLLKERKKKEAEALAEKQRLADEAKAEKQRLADKAERKRLDDIQAQQDAKKKLIDNFKKSARHKPKCFKGEKKLKASPLWAIMKQKKIPNPYRTTWKGFVPYSRLPNGACVFGGVCGGVTAITIFNSNGSYTGYGKAKNKSGRVARIPGSGDKGLLLSCYKKGEFYIYSRSFNKCAELGLKKSECHNPKKIIEAQWRKTLVTAKTKGWNLPNDKLGTIRMRRKVGR